MSDGSDRFNVVFLCKNEEDFFYAENKISKCYFYLYHGLLHGFLHDRLYHFHEYGRT